MMLLAAHHCNWEWLLLRCSTAFGAPLTAAYKPVSREPADRALIAMRSRFGATLVPAKRIVQHLIEQRGSVKLLALVADQSPPASSDQQSWRPFFGEETAFFRGPGWIGAKMGFQPVFIAMRREGRGRYVVRFVPLACERGAARCRRHHLRLRPGRGSPCARASRAVLLGIQPLEARAAPV